MEFKINDFNTRNNWSAKNSQDHYKVLFNSEIGRGFADVFFVCFWSALCLLKNVIFFNFFANVYHIVFKS